MKKLVLTEIAITGLLIGLFIIMFSLMDGWKGEKEKYDAAIFACFTAVISAAIIAVFSILSDDYAALVAFSTCAFASAFGAYVVFFSNAGSALITVGVCAYTIIALIAGFVAFALGRKILKNFLSAISLIAQGLIIFAAFAAVTFLS